MNILLKRMVVVMVAAGFVLACMTAAAGIAYADAAAPGKVEALTLKVTGQPSATVSWKRVDGASGYKIYRNAHPIAKVKENDGIPTDTLYYTDRVLTPGESYRYTVKAYVLDGEDVVYGSPSQAMQILDGYTYEKQDDGEMTLTGYTGREESLTVPTKIAGGTVTEIGDECYRGNVWFKRITVPEGITKVGDYGFEACGSLKKIYLPDSLTEIGDGCFSGCAQLRLLDLQDQVTSIGDGAFLCCNSLSSIALPEDLETIGKFAFGYCDSLSRVDFDGDQVTVIPDRCFSDCGNLAIVNLPESLQTIGKRAFFKCGKLGVMNCPASLVSVGDYCFEGCPNVGLEYSGSGLALGYDAFGLSRCEVPVPETARFGGLMACMQPQEGTYANAGLSGLMYEWEEDSAFRMVDGSLYSADGKILFTYFPYAYDEDEYDMIETDEAQEGVFTVPDGVSRIAPYAFNGSSLTKVTLPSSIREIPANAFTGSGLSRKDVVIPEDAQVTIDENAFDPEEPDEPDDPIDPDDPTDPDDPGEPDDPTDPDDPIDPDDPDEDDYTYGTDVTFESLAGDRSLYDPADYAGYLDLDDDDFFEAWLEKYIEYNKDTVPMTADAMPYITMYTGEDYYRQMTSALNHDAYKTERSIEKSGDDYQEMYLMMDHGVFAELSRGRMCDDLVLFSGITTERASDIAGIDRSIMPTDEQLAAAVGTTIRDEAVMSTTGHLQTAFMFGDYAKAIVIIYASQEALEELGTICVDKFSVFSGEHEVLFNANAKYRVLDSGHVTSTDYRIDNKTGEKTVDGEPVVYKYARLKLLTESEAEAEQLDGTKAAQSMTVKAVKKTVKASKLKKAKKSVKGTIRVKNAVGKVTYAKAGGSARLKVNKKTGKITVRKGTKKGTYKIKVKVKAAGNEDYEVAVKTVTVKIVVK